LRLEAVEQRLEQVQVAGAAAAMPVQPHGLEVGAIVEEFELPDLEGKPVRLADFRGRRLLLVHWSRSCGFCGQVAPELAQLQDGSPVPAFRQLGTPVAYLLDEQARVAAPLAVGANEVPTLAQAAATGRQRLASERSLGESRIEREGIKPGTPAPPFRLPDL